MALAHAQGEEVLGSFRDGRQGTGRQREQQQEIVEAGVRVSVHLGRGVQIGNEVEVGGDALIGTSDSDGFKGADGRLDEWLQRHGGRILCMR